MDFSIAPTPQTGLMHFRLEAEHLRVRWERTGQEIAIPYAAIQRVHVKRPLPAMMSTRVQAGTAVVDIPAREVRNFGVKVDRSEGYVALVSALLSLLANRGSNVEVVVGHSLIWWIGLAVGTFTTFLTVSALVGIAMGGVVLAPGFLGLPIMYFLVWAWMRAGRTRTVSLTTVPRYCLPTPP